MMNMEDTKELKDQEVEITNEPVIEEHKKENG
jgi:hypothetical protein